MSVLKVCHLHATLCCTSTMRREAMSHNRDYLCVFCSGFFETHPFPTIVLNSHAYELLSAWNRGETVQTAWHLIWVWKKNKPPTTTTTTWQHHVNELFALNIFGNIYYRRNGWTVNSVFTKHSKRYLETPNAPNISTKFMLFWIITFW